MPLSNRSAAIAASLLLAGLPLSFVRPVLAASPVTQAFLANLVPNVDFLDRSSRFALDNSKGLRLRAFALSEAREQTLAIDALYDWTQAGAHPPARELVATAAATLPTRNLDPTPTGSARMAWPPRFAADGNPGDGKSADRGGAERPAADARLPKGQEDLDSLEGLQGSAFDAPYKDAQREALQQVETDYADYLAKGDDPVLYALARRELPKIKARLASLGCL